MQTTCGYIIINFHSLLMGTIAKKCIICHFLYFLTIFENLTKNDRYFCHFLGTKSHIVT